MSYASDYSRYYSQAHRNIEKKVARIHFFSERLPRKTIIDSLGTANFKTYVAENYLGHITLKPILNSLVGASIVKTYPQTKARFFSVVRNYTVNLFGEDINLKSLVFQQQDGAVSACATAALWMAFHKTHLDFRHALHTPHEITSLAGYGDGVGRNFPSTGLDVNQIISAIAAHGLDPELRTRNKFKTTYLKDDQLVTESVLEPIFLKRFAYSYLSAQIPVLLGFNYGTAYHLVTLNGYRFVDDEKEIMSLNHVKDDHPMIADYLCRLYCHDDQIGPFARIGFPQYFPNAISFMQESKIAYPRVLIVPLQTSIRVNYNDISDVVRWTHLQYKVPGQPTPYIWDIRLLRSNDYKRTACRNRGILPSIREKIVTASLPKYVWVASQYAATDLQHPLMDMVFDSTGTRGAFCCDMIHFYSPAQANLARRVFEQVLASSKDDYPDFYADMIVESATKHLANT
ncbi:MAG: hypothetical protein JNN32_02285 [Flavobacteriales bacterium]|nr:hypothetical protein [Flavobacteriales bacterium]